MAEGLRKGDGGIHLQTFHPPGDKSSYDFFVQANWIDFHMSQSGHSTTSKNYKFNIKNTALTPLRPHLDGEPRYEDHPNRWEPLKYGWMDDLTRFDPMARSVYAPKRLINIGRKGIQGICLCFFH